MFRGVMIAIVFTLGSASLHSGQTLDQKNLAIGMTKYIDDAITAKHPNSNEKRRKVSVRLLSCGGLYSALSMNPDNSSDIREKFKLSNRIFSETSAALYPGKSDEFQNDAKSIVNSIKAIKADQKKLFYFLRNCKDFSEPTTVEQAITELLLTNE